MTVDLDHTFVHLVETRDEVRDCRLARARRTDEGDELAGTRLKRHMRERGSALLVGKGHVLDSDAPFDFGQRNSAFLVMNRLFHVDHIKDAIGRRHRTLHGAVDAADALDWVREVHGIGQKGYERARRNLALHDLVTADPQDDCDGDRREELNGRRQQARQLHVLHLGLEIQLVLSAETLDLVALAHEGLDDAHRRDAFLQQRVDVGKPFLNDRARLLELSSKDLHRLSDERHGDERDQRELPVEIEHEHDGTDEDRGLRHEFDELVDERVLQRLHVVRHVAHDLPCLMAVEVGERHALELLEERLADVDDDTLSDKGNEVTLPIIEHAAEEEDDDDAARDEVEHRHVALHEHLVDHVLDDPRHIEVRPCRQHDARDSGGELLHIGADVFHQTDVVLHASLSFSLPAAAASTCAATRTEAPGGPSCSTATLSRAMTESRCGSPL